MWDYAALSQAAKLEGGPEALVNHLLAQGISKGKVSMIPWLFVTFGVGGAVTFGITKGTAVSRVRQSTAACFAALGFCAEAAFNFSRRDSMLLSPCSLADQ